MASEGKNRKILLYLFFISISVLPLSGMVSNDSIIAPADSVRRHRRDSVEHHLYRLRETAQQVVTTLFKPDKELIADSLIKQFDNAPSFDAYKDNYIVLGSDLFRKPNKDNSDAKFQISVRQKLTNSVLPFKTYLFLTYSQLAFWDVFKESFPFRDINFNPTVGVGKPLIYRNRYLGEIAVQLEHESNGKAEEDSRSWNKVSFQGVFKFTSHWTLFGKLWIPIIDGENNKDLTHYKGYGITALTYNQKNKFNIGLVLNHRAGSFLGPNVTVNASYRLFKNDNQYMFFEFYNGYGEGLLDYKEYHQRFRLGFVIKPNFSFVY